MTTWVASILLSQGQGAAVRTLVEAGIDVAVTISVDQPKIHIVSVWNGNDFDTKIVGEDHLSGYAVSVGDGEISYLVKYVADVGALSTVTIDGQVKEASVSLVGG